LRRGGAAEPTAPVTRLSVVWLALGLAAGMPLMLAHSNQRLEWLGGLRPRAPPLSLDNVFVPARPRLPDAGRAAAVIDWIDLSYNNPGVDLVLYWSVLPAEGREAFLEAYGTIGDDQLLCARILSLFLCGTLALYGHHERMPRLKREALAGLDRTINRG
jgi:hypothetical protein